MSELFEFPCTFPIKVMGEHDAGIEAIVKNVLNDLVDDPSTIMITTRDSAGGKYISVSAKFTATSKEQLDNIYKAISSNDAVKMVL